MIATKDDAHNTRTNVNHALSRTCRSTRFAFPRVYTRARVNNVHRMSPEQLTSQLISHRDAAPFEQLDEIKREAAAINYKLQ